MYQIESGCRQSFRHMGRKGITSDIRTIRTRTTAHEKKTLAFGTIATIASLQTGEKGIYRLESMWEIILFYAKHALKAKP